MIEKTDLAMLKVFNDVWIVHNVITLLVCAPEYMHFIEDCALPPDPMCVMVMLKRERGSI